MISCGFSFCCARIFLSHLPFSSILDVHKVLSHQYPVPSIDYVAGPQLNTPIRQLGASGVLTLVLVFDLGHVQKVVGFGKVAGQKMG